MSVKFLGSTSSAVVGSSIEVATPAFESLKAGDLLFAYIVVQGYVGTVLTPPSAWVVEPNPIEIGDQIVFTALHYVSVDEEDQEGPTSSVFSYSASKPMVCVVEACRGVQQDILYDPVNYPFGYYAPGGSVGTANTQTGVTSVSTPSSGSSSFKAYSRSLFFFGATHASLTPKLSDPSPFLAIRSRVESAQASAMLVDSLQTNPHTSPLSSVASNASVTLSGAVGLVRVFEPLVEAADSYDTYKAKIMRHQFMPPAFDVTYGELTANLLTAIGGCDNDLGGLFGDEDFLPDEV